MLGKECSASVYGRPAFDGHLTDVKRFKSVLRVDASVWRAHTDGQWLRMAKDGHGRT